MLYSTTMACSVRREILKCRTKLFSQHLPNQCIDSSKFLIIGPPSAAAQQYCFISDQPIENKRLLSLPSSSFINNFTANNCKQNPLYARFHKDSMPGFGEYLQEKEDRKNGIPRDPNLPSEEQLYAAHKILVDHFPRTYHDHIPGEVFDMNMVYENQIYNFTLKGFTNYYLYMTFQKIYYTLAYTAIEPIVLNSDISTYEGSVTIRWRIYYSNFFHTAFTTLKTAKLPTKGNMRCHDGLSTYYLNKEGKTRRLVVDNRVTNRGYEKPGLISKLYSKASAKLGLMCYPGQKVKE